MWRRRGQSEGTERGCPGDAQEESYDVMGTLDGDGEPCQAGERTCNEYVWQSRNGFSRHPNRGNMRDKCR